MPYACPAGQEMRLKWERQRADKRLDADWVELAHADYMAHRRTCPVCRQILDNWQGNIHEYFDIAYPVDWPVKVEQEQEA